MKQENKDGVKSGGKFVVVCCVCDKTRNDIGKWIAQPYSHSQNSGVVYSHGLCPDCLQSQYGNEVWYKQYEKDLEGKQLSEAGGRMGRIKKMLIIDDNRMITTLLTADFEDDFKVEVAKDGPEGLVLARCWLPEIILLDINMPGMSGVDVVRRLEYQCETKNIPVIVITASEFNDASRQQLQPYGNFKGFLSKMTPTEEIRKTVRQILR